MVARDSQERMGYPADTNPGGCIETELTPTGATLLVSATRRCARVARNAMRA